MSGVNQQTNDVQLQKHFSIIDHAVEDGIEGLLSAVTVKFTTARGVSEILVNRAMEKLGRPRIKSASRNKPIWGGDVSDFASFVSLALEKMNGVAGHDVKTHLLNTYGSQYHEILDLASEDKSLLAPLAADTSVLGAEIVNGVRNEMAQKLCDVAMRRTELGTAGKPSHQAVSRAADLMAAELGWSEEQKKAEIADYFKIYEIK